MAQPVTYLFVPGDRPDRFPKALASGADRVVLDLEDVVRPEAKAMARDAIRTADIEWARVLVRVNQAGSPFWVEDLALLRDRPTAAMLPKAEDPQAIATLHATGPEVLPQIEVALGLDRVDSLLAALGVAHVAFGHLDYAMDIGAEPSWDALTMTRQHLVWRSRLAGRAAPVDSITADLHEASLRRDTADARMIGFGGKLLIHPAQVAPCTQAFIPGPEEIDWANRVLDVVKTGKTGAIALDGRMIDKPAAKAALRVLDLIKKANPR